MTLDIENQSCNKKANYVLYNHNKEYRKIE